MTKEGDHSKPRVEYDNCLTNQEFQVIDCLKIKNNLIRKEFDVI